MNRHPPFIPGRTGPQLHYELWHISGPGKKRISTQPGAMMSRRRIRALFGAAITIP